MALDLASCQIHAKAICGCYRRDEAQDPETFAAALAVVLQDYPADIVRLASDPRTGVITAFPMGLPNVGQIREFLEAKLVRQERLQHLASLPTVDASRRLPKPPLGPGDMANVFVPADSITYPRMMERAKTGDEREFRHEQGGIRVALGWFAKPNQEGQRFKTISADDLRALYPKVEKRSVLPPGECSYCDEHRGGMCPPHDASDSCESGKHDHCTCDSCF